MKVETWVVSMAGQKVEQMAESMVDKRAVKLVAETAEQTVDL